MNKPRAAPGPALRAATAVSVLVALALFFAACAGPLAPGTGTGAPEGTTGPNVTLPGLRPPAGGAAQAPLSVEVSSVEFRPADHREDAAVRYQLKLTNTGDRLLFVRIDQNGLRGTDDQGTEYEDYWSQAERNNAEGCTCTECRPPDFARLTSIAVPLTPGTEREVVLFLNPVDAPADCERSGRARGRVDPATAGIDLSLPDVSFQPGGSAPLSGLELRLEPGGPQE